MMELFEIVKRCFENSERLNRTQLMGTSMAPPNIAGTLAMCKWMNDIHQGTRIRLISPIFNRDIGDTGTVIGPAHHRDGNKAEGAWVIRFDECDEGGLWDNKEWAIYERNFEVIQGCDE